MNQYELLIEELKTRIRLVWGTNLQISAGRPKIPFASAPYAVILMEGVVSSSGSGRSAVRDWNFQIVGMFPYDQDRDSEQVIMEKLELLHQKLEPYDELVVPPVDPSFAGICQQHYVKSFAPMEEEIEDAFVGCVMDFFCQTRVFV